MKKTQAAPAEAEAFDQRIEGIEPSGAGVARIDGLDVVVPGALPGDRADFRWRRPRPGGRRGLATGPVRIRALSTDRTPPEAPRCPHAGRCGGCPLAPLRYEAELSLKTRQLLAEPLARAGFPADKLIAACHGQPEGERAGFRNKAVLYPAVIGEAGKRCGRFGFFRAGTHEVVPAEDCPLAPRWMQRAARIAASLIHADPASAVDPFALYDEAAGTGSVRALLMREGATLPNAEDEKRGERLLTLVLARRPDDQALERIRSAFSALELEHLSVNVHPARGNAVLSFAPGATLLLRGQPAIRTSLDSLVFDVRPETFLQVNTPQTPRLYARALSLLELGPKDNFLDLYCGIGTLTLLGARRAKRALGIEIVEASVALAQENARRNGIGNASFLAGAVEDVLQSETFQKLAQASPFNKAIVDPAYKGLAPGVAPALAALELERIVYIACGPKNFVRDAAALDQLGYALERVEALDLFPGALHIEAIGLFRRRC